MGGETGVVSVVLRLPMSVGGFTATVPPPSRLVMLCFVDVAVFSNVLVPKPPAGGPLSVAISIAWSSDVFPVVPTVALLMPTFPSFFLPNAPVTALAAAPTKGIAFTTKTGGFSVPSDFLTVT